MRKIKLSIPKGYISQAHIEWLEKRGFSVTVRN